VGDWTGIPGRRLAKASTPTEHIGRSAPDLGLEGRMQRRGDALDAGQAHVIVGGFGHGPAVPGHVGGAAQIPVRGAVQRVQIAVGIGNGLIAKTGQTQTLGKSPALIGDPIGDQIIGVGIGLIDERQAAIAHDGRRLQDWYTTLNTGIVDLSDHRDAFDNVNTPEQLAAMTARLTGR